MAILLNYSYDAEFSGGYLQIHLDVVGGLACLNDPEGLAPDRGSHVGKAEGVRPNKKPACPDAKVATPPPESDAEG
jgi:hypothetical protein